MLKIDINLQRAHFNLSVQMELPERGLCAVFGDSAAGKSTLLNCIAGFETVSSGSQISLGDIQFLQPDGRALPIHQRGIAYVTQQPSLFHHLTVQHNLDFARQRSFNPQSAQSADAIKQLKLNSMLSKYPHQLSGGEQQRVAIARALYSEPNLLLFDEPLSALDYNARQQVLGYLENLRNQLDIPIIYVTHSVEEIMRLSDHIAVISAGRLIRLDNAHKVLSDPNSVFSQRPDAGVIVEGDVSEMDSSKHLGRIQLTKNVDLWTSGQIPAIGSRVRVRVYARDVSIALRRAVGSSILNILEGSVESLLDSGDGQVLVVLNCGGIKLLARVTRKSVDELKIYIGLQVFAQVKGVALLGAVRNKN